MTDDNFIENQELSPFNFKPALTRTEFNQLCCKQKLYQPYQVAVWLFLTKTPEQFRQLVLNDLTFSIEITADLEQLNEYLCDSLEHGREALSRLRLAIRTVQQ